jgi:hypothetical protein
VDPVLINTSIWDLLNDAVPENVISKLFNFIPNSFSWEKEVSEMQINIKIKNIKTF